MDIPKIGSYVAKQDFVFHCPGMTSTVPQGAHVRVTQVNLKAGQAVLAVGQHAEWFSFSCVERWLRPLETNQEQ